MWGMGMQRGVECVCQGGGRRQDRLLGKGKVELVLEGEEMSSQVGGEESPVL